ncbi:MAG: tail fiber domain-containing protein [Elusimicrobiota bacterium]
MNPLKFKPPSFALKWFFQLSAFLFVLAFSLTCLLSVVFADVPARINYQGRLKVNNLPVNGDLTMRFKLWDALGDEAGNTIWDSGDQTVSVSSGLFNYVLTGGAGAYPDLQNVQWKGETPYLEVTVDGNVMSPREQLNTVPYAMLAASATYAMSAGNAGGWEQATAEGGRWRTVLRQPISDQGVYAVAIGTGFAYGALNISTNTDHIILHVQGADANNRIWAIKGEKSGSDHRFEIVTANDAWTGWNAALQIYRSAETVTKVLFPTGSVGISVGSPIEKLEVGGSVKITGSLLMDGEDIKRAGTTTDKWLTLMGGTATGSGAYLQLSGLDQTAEIVDIAYGGAQLILSQATADPATTSKFKIKAGNYLTNPPALIVMASGKVGIATHEPYAELDISTGTFRLTDQYAASGNYQLLQGNQYGLNVSVSNVADGRLRIGEVYGELGIFSGDNVAHDLYLLAAAGKEVHLTPNGANAGVDTDSVVISSVSGRGVTLGIGGRSSDQYIHYDLGYDAYTIVGASLAIYDKAGILLFNSKEQNISYLKEDYGIEVFGNDSHPLQVVGASIVLGDAVGNNYSTGRLYTHSDATRNLWIGSIAGKYSVIVGSNMYVEGSVRFGTINPTDDASNSILGTVYYDSNTNRLYLCNGVNYWVAITTGIASGLSGSGSPGTIPKWDTASSLTSSVMVESAGGYIGIGRYPGYTLDVNGNAAADNLILYSGDMHTTHNYDKINISGGENWNDGAFIELGGDIKQSSDVNFGSVQIVISSRTVPGESDIPQFRVRRRQGWQDLLVVKADGRVGIMASEPLGALHISSTTAAHDQYMILVSTGSDDTTYPFTVKGNGAVNIKGDVTGYQSGDTVPRWQISPTFGGDATKAGIGFGEGGATALDTAIWREAGEHMRTSAYIFDRNVEDDSLRFIGGTTSTSAPSIELHGPNEDAAWAKSKLRLIVPQGSVSQGFDIVGVTPDGGGGWTWPSLITISTSGVFYFGDSTSKQSMWKDDTLKGIAFSSNVVFAGDTGTDSHIISNDNFLIDLDANNNSFCWFEIKDSVRNSIFKVNEGGQIYPRGGTQFITSDLSDSLVFHGNFNVDTGDHDLYISTPIRVANIADEAYIVKKQLGQIFYDTGTNQLKLYTGASFVALTTGGDAVERATYLGASNFITDTGDDGTIDVTYGVNAATGVFTYGVRASTAVFTATGNYPSIITSSGITAGGVARFNGDGDYSIRMASGIYVGGIASIAMTESGISRPMIDLAIDAEWAKWIGCDTNWYFAFTDDIGFRWYHNAGKTWGSLLAELDDSGALSLAGNLKVGGNLIADSAATTRITFSAATPNVKITGNEYITDQLIVVGSATVLSREGLRVGDNRANHNSIVISSTSVQGWSESEANPRWSIEKNAGGGEKAGIAFGPGGSDVMDTKLWRSGVGIFRTNATQIERDSTSSVLKIVGGPNGAIDASIELYSGSAADNEGRIKLLLPFGANGKGLEILRASDPWNLLVKISTTSAILIGQAGTGQGVTTIDSQAGLALNEGGSGISYFTYPHPTATRYLNSYGFGFHDYNDGVTVGVNSYTAGLHGINLFSNNVNRLRIKESGDIVFGWDNANVNSSTYTYATGDLRLGGDLTIVGNTILGSDGGAKITLAASPEVTVEGDLTVTGTLDATVSNTTRATYLGATNEIRDTDDDGTLNITYGVAAATGVFTYGVNASTGVFTRVNGYSIVSASGIYIDSHALAIREQQLVPVIDLAVNAGKAKWFGFDTNWFQANTNDTGFRWYESSTKDWGTQTAQLTIVGFYPGNQTTRYIADNGTSITLNGGPVQFGSNELKGSDGTTRVTLDAGSPNVILSGDVSITGSLTATASRATYLGTSNFITDTGNDGTIDITYGVKAATGVFTYGVNAATGVFTNNLRSSELYTTYSVNASSVNLTYAVVAQTGTFTSWVHTPYVNRDADNSDMRLAGGTSQNTAASIELYGPTGGNGKMKFFVGKNTGGDEGIIFGRNGEWSTFLTITTTGSILMNEASNADNASPAITSTLNDDFSYGGKYINHYGFGFHAFNDGAYNGRNSYVAGYSGVNLFTGGANRLHVNQGGDIFFGFGNGTTVSTYTYATGDLLLARYLYLGNQNTRYLSDNGSAIVVNGDMTVTGALSATASNATRATYLGTSNFITDTGNDGTIDLTFGVRAATAVFTYGVKASTGVFTTFVQVGSTLSVMGGTILISQASADALAPTGITDATQRDQFAYSGRYINHYGFGTHEYSDGTYSGRNAYMASWPGVNIFAGGANRLRINQAGDIIFGWDDGLNSSTYTFTTGDLKLGGDLTLVGSDIKDAAGTTRITFSAAAPNVTITGNEYVSDQLITVGSMTVLGTGGLRVGNNNSATGTLTVDRNQIYGWWEAEANPRWGLDRDMGGGGIAGIGFGPGGPTAIDTKLYRNSAYELRSTANQLTRDVTNGYWKIIAGDNSAQDGTIEIYGRGNSGNEGRVRMLLGEGNSGKGMDIMAGGSWATLVTVSTTGQVAIPLMNTGTYNTVSMDTGSGRLYVASSSKRFKENIKPLKDNFGNILKIEPKTFNYISTKQKDIGYIAEEFDALGLKQLVIYDKDGKPNTVKYDKIPVYILEIVKQQQQALEVLQAQNKDLESRIKSLEKRIK